MIKFHGSCDHQVCNFFVRKKSGALRLVVDARSTNSRFCDPPSTRLASTAAVVEFECPTDQDLWFSVQNIADCFYQFKIPEEMFRFFGLLPAPADAIGLDPADGTPTAPGELLYPCLSVLPMGFSWALHWVQEAHRQLLSCAGLGGIGREWVDRAPCPHPREGQPCRLVCVGNQLFIANHPGDGPRERILGIRKLGEQGVPFHEIEDGPRLVTTIGLELGGVLKTGRFSEAKRWKLRQAWLAIRRRPIMSGQQLEALVGHFTHAMLLNRPSLSVFRATYDFMRRHYYSPWRLSVFNELRAAAGLVSLPIVHWTLPWSLVVGCSDASGYGSAAQEATWPVPRVSEVGRWSGRWRFRPVPDEAPQARAFRLGPSAPDDPDCTVVVDEAFPEIPHAYLEHEWGTIQVRPYCYP